MCGPKAIAVLDQPELETRIIDHVAEHTADSMRIRVEGMDDRRASVRRKPHIRVRNQHDIDGVTDGLVPGRDRIPALPLAEADDTRAGPLGEGRGCVRGRGVDHDDLVSAIAKCCQTR